MAREYVIYCDESSKHGPFYGNFYGGALVRSSDLVSVKDSIKAAKAKNQLHGEIKWGKVTENYLGKYIDVMETFFGHIRRDRVKVRIMFTNNRSIPFGLSRTQLQNSYQLLYYQFLKHAFGLQYSNPGGGKIGLRLYLDRLPLQTRNAQQLKAFLGQIAQTSTLGPANLAIDTNQIAEVDSHNHDILQCLDVVLGAIQFRLNDFHLGSERRTVAKRRLYEVIGKQIRSIYPNFNIGISTGVKGDKANRWRHSYRHWEFKPTKSRIDLWAPGKRKKSRRSLRHRSGPPT